MGLSFKKLAGAAFPMTFGLNSLGGMMGGGGNTTTTSSNIYSPEQLEAQKQLYGAAGDWYKQYGGANSQGSIAPMDPAYISALNQTAGIAQNGTQTSQSGLDLANKTLGGYFLNSNPYIDATFNRGADQIQSRVNSQFGLAGRTGSGAHQGVMGSTLGNLATDIYGGNYANERQNQMNAMSMLPQLQAANYYDPSVLAGVGQSRMNYNQQLLDAPYTQLSRYGNIISPAFGPTGTSTTQPYSNNMGSTLGSLLGMGAGAAMGGVPGAMLGGQFGGMAGSMFNK